MTATEIRTPAQRRALIGTVLPAAWGYNATTQVASLQSCHEQGYAMRIEKCGPTWTTLRPINTETGYEAPGANEWRTSSVVGLIDAIAAGRIEVGR